jgi:hypothetical protein
MQLVRVFQVHGIGAGSGAGISLIRSLLASPPGAPLFANSAAECCCELDSLR